MTYVFEHSTEYFYGCSSKSQISYQKMLMNLDWIYWERCSKLKRSAQMPNWPCAICAKNKSRTRTKYVIVASGSEVTREGFSFLLKGSGVQREARLMHSWFWLLLKKKKIQCKKQKLQNVGKTVVCETQSNVRREVRGGGGYDRWTVVRDTKYKPRI